MIHIDTSALIASLCGSRAALPALIALTRDGYRVGVSALVLYEFWRGPRTDEEMQDQARLFPQAEAFGFGEHEAAIAAELYRAVKHPHGREIDLAIAACAIAQEAALWTLDPRDVADIPGLDLVRG